MPGRMPRHAGRLQGVALILPITLSTMGVVALTPIVPAMSAHFRAVPHHVLLTQLILTIPALCVALCSTPAGWLADRLGRRRLLLLAMGFYGLAGVLPYFLPSLYAILATRILIGMTESLIMVCSTALIGDYFAGPARDKWLAYQTAIAALAAVLLFAASGLLARGLGWRGPFWLYASSFGLLVLLLFTTWEPAAPAPRPGAVADPGFPLLRILGICAVTLVGAIGFFIGQVELGVALVQLHLADLALIGLYSALVSLAVPTGSVTFRLVVSRLPVRRQLLIAFPLMGAGLVVAGAAHSVAVLLAGIAVNLLGAGITLPTLLTWVMRPLSFAQRGRGVGLYMASFETGQFLSALLATWFASRFGSVQVAFAAFGVVALLLGPALYLTLGRPARAPA